MSECFSKNGHSDQSYRCSYLTYLETIYWNMYKFMEAYHIFLLSVLSISLATL